MSAGSATTLREATGKSCCANAQQDQRGLQIEDEGAQRRRRLRNGRQTNLARGVDGEAAASSKTGGGFGWPCQRRSILGAFTRATERATPEGPPLVRGAVSY